MHRKQIGYILLALLLVAGLLAAHHFIKNPPQAVLIEEIVEEVLD